MRLIQHVSGLEPRRLAMCGIDQLVQDQEELERVDRAGVEIVVAVFAVVEVEAAELAELDEPGDDHLDVDVGSVMPEIHQASGLRSQLGGGE